MIKLVILDMDGTMFNTIGGIANSANYVFESYGYPSLNLDFYMKAVGGGAGKLIEKAMDKLSMNTIKHEIVVKEFIEHYFCHYEHDLYMYEGIQKLIVKLNDAGKIVTINTNKPHSIAEKVIEGSFRKNEIRKVIGRQEKYLSKPNPEGALELMRQFNASPHETIYIGDSRVDVETAKNAGIKCIGVTWGFGVRAEVELADYIVHNAKMIEEIILCM